MKRARPILKQPTPQELTDACLGLLRSKFYAGDERGFFQDRRLLLKWVVLFPASWLNARGVTIHGDRYREIFFAVFLQAAANVQSKVKYRPAYLRQVIQSHFRIHGEDYYEAAKTTRNLAEQTLQLLGKAAPAAADPVRDLALAAKLIKTPVRGSKKEFKKPVIKQADLF